MFGRATITLGIGPHSSYCLNFHMSFLNSIHTNHEHGPLTRRPDICPLPDICPRTNAPNPNPFIRGQMSGQMSQDIALVVCIEL